MADIASLGIQITTNGVQQAASDLDKLAVSGDKAAASTSKLNKSFSQGQAAPVRQAAAALNEQSAALAKLAGQIDPTIAKLDKLDAMQDKLAGFKKSGLIGADDFNALNSALDASRAKIGAAADGVSHFTLNNSLARRELGYLAKDIANGNWGRFEQSALTLASNSGLMAMAFSAVGVAVLGTIAALGLGIVAFAKGQAETDAFNKSLIQTGDYAGATAAQLQSMAKATAGTIGTQHDAAGALAAVVASGKFAGTQLQVVTDAALEMEKSTGQAIGETIKQFTALADDPVNAIVKLNDTQHFLTDAVYEQIKALQDQGRAQEAADLAENTYANSISTRTDSIKNNLGTLETAWNSVKNAASTAWSAMLNIGRPDDAETKLLKLQDSANALGKQLQALKDAPALGGSGYGNLGNNARSQEIATLQAKFDAAAAAYHKEEHAQSDDGVAAAKASSLQRANEVAITLGQEADQYASAEDKRAKEIAAAHQKANDAIAKLNATSDATLIAQIRTNEAKVVAGIESREKKPAKAKADPFASLNGLVQKAQVFDQGVGNDKADNAQVTAILAIVDAGAKLIASGQDVAKVQADVAKGVAALNEGYAKQADILKQQNAVALKTYQEAIDQQIADKQKQIDLQVAAIGMSAKEVQQQTELNAIYSQVDKTIEQLNRARAQKGANVEYIDGEIAAQKASIPILVAQENAKFKAMDAAQADWLNGAKTAMKDWADAGMNAANLMASFTNNAFSTMNDALATFATTGKLNFKQMVASILTDLAKMELRIAESKILQSVLGMFTGGYDTTGGAGTSTYNSMGGVSHVNFGANAKGGVYTSPSLSAYSGQIVTQPTAFAFAKGAGIMGEAGPEAILPLSRGADGKLGVKAGGSGGDVNISQTFVIDSNGNASGNTSGAGDDSIRQFAGKMKSVAQQTILDEQRPGGSLWRMGQRA